MRTYMVSDEPVVPSQRDLYLPNIMECVDGNQVVVDWMRPRSMRVRKW